MRYYVDGNNLAGLIFRSSSEGVREKLFHLLQRKKLPKSTTIVFDGYPFGNSAGKGSRGILFSQKEKADDVIVSKLVRGDFVVTNDRELQSRAKVRGAKIAELAEFLSKIEPKDTSGEKPLRENDIEEWLRIFSEKKDEK
jgi:hypothetical protein